MAFTITFMNDIWGVFIPFLLARLLPCNYLTEEKMSFIRAQVKLRNYPGEGCIGSYRVI